ncbi:MAG: InlB B-repeat-containing protein [Roseburia intestinalis]
MRNRITQLSRFLLLCAVMFLVTMIPQSVKAITVEEAGEAYMTDSQAGAGQPLYGRLNINYTGNTNYDTWSNDVVTNYNTYDSKADQYKAAETVLKKADNSVIGKKIKNNRSAKLTKSEGADGTIRAAYLVWQARTSIKRSDTDAKALAKSEIAFVMPDGTAKLIKAQYATYDNRSIDYIDQKKENGVNKQYTFVNMYADVTDIINKSDKIYGTYSVFNIPYYEHIGGGEGAGGWQLIVVENCDITVPMRAVRLRMSADFNIDDVSKHDGEWVEKDIKTGMLTSIKSKAYKANDKEPLTGQYLTIFVYSGNTAVNLTKLNLYAQKASEKFDKNKKIFGLSKDVSPYLSINGNALYSKATTTRGDLVDFTIKKESTQPAYANQYYTLQTNTGDFTKWVTMFVTGIAVDISDNFAEGNQVTTVKSPTTVNVSQKITNKTLQTKTGYYNGKLVVTLDEALTPTNTKPELTVYNKEADTKTTIKGTWNAKNHTVTFAVDTQGDKGTFYEKSKFKNPSRGSYISYSIDCTYEKNSGVEEFKNGSRLSGDLRSQNVATGTTIDDILTKESVGVPIYVLTVKIDKTTVNKAVTQVFNNGTAITGAGGTVNSSSTVSGDYYMASYELPCNANIVSTPTFNTGCVFSMWTDLNEKTGVSTNCKVTSDYVNDKTYAYERSMPAYNMTLTLTGVLDEAVYTVRHWKQKTTGIASTHDDKNYELAETETKKAQIGSKVTPAVKTYTGFDSPKTQTKVVTADGKMVIDYYYERHLYNVILNAGTGIEKTTGGGSYRYGQSVTIDAAVKEGYHWLNWKGNYKGGSGGEQTVDAKKFVFTMPAGNVTMTANAEANRYTIHFDPNGGAGHIDDIETTYDTDVTLPDVWNADGTAAYVKYTLDGQNVTEDVIAGVIPKAMMDGYEEEETEDMENTEDPDNAEDPEGAGNSEDEDSENNGDDSDAGNSDADAQDSMDAMDESGNAETADNSDEADDAEMADSSDEADEAEMADNSDESDDTDNPDVTDDTDQNEKVAVTKENKDDAEDIDAFNDLEEEDIEENKKAEEPKKKVYASVFMGWSLEDGKDTFIPQWKAGDAVRNLVAEDGGEITLYAVWDDCPWIQAQDLYYTLEQAQSGFITEEEILSHATATDREDGSPILPGTNPAPSDPEVFTSFTIPDYQAEEFTNLQHDFATSENLTVVDHVGNTYVKQIMVHVTDTTPKKLTQMDLTGVTRFINSKYYNKSFEEGGLEDNSIWKVDPEYKAALESALNNMDHDTPMETYVFSKETIKQMKQYVETHGIGNSKEPDALNNFYNQFLAPNRK